MPIKRVFTANATGGIATTGNTLGLWGQNNPPDPVGSLTTTSADGIGAFTTNNTALRYDSYPYGTTTDWSQNSSSNILTLPGGSAIISAWLFYSATQINAVSDVTSYIYNPIGFTAPSGAYTSITPQPANVITMRESSDNTYYHACIDITDIMEGSGSYTISGVPGCLGKRIVDTVETNYAGWTIIVAYYNSSQPMRNLTIWDIFDYARSDRNIDINLVGFATPPEGYPLSGKLFFTAAAGDNHIAYDQAMFGPDTASLIPLYGPNNGENNFFQSQINDDNGILSTTGTFGTRNQPFGGSGVGPVSEAARQGWDKTAIDISSLLQNNQTSAVIRLMSNQDLYFPQAAATEINLLRAVLNPVKSVTPSTAMVGDTLRYSITFTNSGQETAYNVIFQDSLPVISTNVSFVPGSLTINGVSAPYDPVAGFTLPGTYPPGAAATIEFDVHVDGMPDPNPYTNVAAVTYTYVPSAGGDAITADEYTNPVIVRIIDVTRGVAFVS